MKVVNLGKSANNGMVTSPETALTDALEAVKDKSGAFAGKKILILALDETDGNYHVHWMQAGMKMSQCLSLCEVAKIQFLTEMQYIPDD